MLATRAALVTGTKFLSVVLSTLYIAFITNSFPIKTVGEYFVVNSLILVLSVGFKAAYDSLIIKNFDITKHVFMEVLRSHTRQTFLLLFSFIILIFIFGGEVLDLINIDEISKYYLILFILCGYLYSKTLLHITLIQLNEKYLLYGFISTILIPSFSITITYFTRDVFFSLVITYGLLFIVSWSSVHILQDWSLSTVCTNIRKGQISLCTIQYVSLISQYFVVFFVSAVSTAENVAAFSLGQRLSSLLLMLMMGVNVISSPKFSIYYKEGNWLKIKDVYKNMQLYLIAIVLPTLLVFLTFSNQVISLFSNELVQYSSIVIILFLGQSINVATGSVGSLLMMTGNESVYRKYIVLCNSLLLMSIYPVSKLYGAIGLAISVSFFVALINIMSMVKVRTILNENISK